MKTQIIKFKGREWLLQSATDRRLIFHPAKSQAGDKLKIWRVKHNINQRTAAGLLNISQAHLAKMELGSRNVPQAILDQI